MVRAEKRIVYRELGDCRTARLMILLTSRFTMVIDAKNPGSQTIFWKNGRESTRTTALTDKYPKLAANDLLLREFPLFTQGMSLRISLTADFDNVNLSQGVLCLKG